MWGKRDSDNLASIASSLEKLADREQERQLIEHPESHESFLQRLANTARKKKEEIKVHETAPIEEEAMKEELKTIQQIQNKVYNAEKDGNMPFFPEALLDEEELEAL